MDGAHSNFEMTRLNGDAAKRLRHLPTAPRKKIQIYEK